MSPALLIVLALGAIVYSTVRDMQDGHGQG